MNPMDDRELERLLREVPIPINLKENLLRIPEQGRNQRVVKTVPYGRGSNIAWVISLATTAALVFILASVWIHKSNSPDPIQTANEEDIQQQIADCLRRMEEINAEMDVAIAESRLESKRSTITRNEVRLSQQDLYSLILAESGRAAIQFGLSTKVVQKDLQSIQKRYPNTKGAVIASDLLSQPEFN